MGKGYQLGTFKGAFTPSILAILGEVDIWWRGQQGNIGLTLTLAYLLKRSRRWSDTRVKLKRVVADEAERAEVDYRKIVGLR